ncbi:hypothetical protein J010_07104 [Cryptococcus neoformans]|nr:hypothetical protein J010_07104 [Cryptococcus neoformans var. grubii]OXH20647.1 hypothetical protein J009_07095 [Cryptococcus neoformans var. grubii]OXH41686.1 hypothetical protein J003_07097 [Cryptococcus neoformans var. grubii]OXH42929.1 hypothetical protein J002_07102 [Cryptococcus neoformans var. grubii]
MQRRKSTSQAEITLRHLVDTIVLSLWRKVVIRAGCSVRHYFGCLSGLSISCRESTNVTLLDDWETNSSSVRVARGGCVKSTQNWL